MYKILFVCTGNICRSPTAEGILQHGIDRNQLGDKIIADSAGLHNFHAGEAPDPRSQTIAQLRGVSLQSIRARQFTTHDYHECDLILAMDETHLTFLHQHKPKQCRATVALFLDYVENEHASEVPDPYYGDEGDFAFVYDLIAGGIQALIKKVQRQESVE